MLKKLQFSNNNIIIVVYWLHFIRNRNEWRKNCLIFFFNIENYVTPYSIEREKENHKSEFKLTYYYIYNILYIQA